MKRKILLPLLLLCVGSVAVGTATGCNKDPEPTTMETLISTDSIALDVNEEYVLNVDYDGTKTPVWTVADPTIAKVENGKLIALKEGTTTVTVTVGSYTDTVTVTVAALDASKLSLEVAEPNVTLYKNDEKQIVATVKYNGEEFNVTAEKSYESMDPDIVSVDATGKMTAKDFGSATVIVKYTVGGTEISAVVNVSITSSGSVEIDQSSVELNYNGEPVTLTAKAYENSEEQTNATITWTAEEGQDVIEINGGTITAKNAGETEVTATYVDSDGQTQTDTITVTVLPIDMDKTADTTVEGSSFKDAEKYEVNSSALGLEGDVTGAYVFNNSGIKTDIPYEDGKLDFTVLNAGNWELYLVTRNVTYKVSLTIIGPVMINSMNFAAELKNTDSEKTYMLEENIDLSDIAWTTPASFTGTFDGDGYMIRGVVVTANSGLFGELRDATIKNVSVIDAELGGKDAGVFAATTDGEVTFENVYVSIAQTAFGEYRADSDKVFILDDAYGKGGLVGYSTSALTVKDCVIYMPENLTKANGFVAGSAESTIAVENSTFIGGNGLTYGARDGRTATVTGTPVVIDAVAAYKALYGDDFDATQKENVNGWTDMQIAAYELNHALKVVGAADVETSGKVKALFRGMTSEIVVLTVDILYNDPQDQLDISYNNGGNFTGVFDGQNHKMTGLVAASASTRRGGLFYTFAGSLKNVSLKGEIQQNGGLVAQLAMYTAYLENVYAETKISKDSAGGLFMRVRTQNGEASLSMKNVVINADNTSKEGSVGEQSQEKNGAVLAYGCSVGGDNTDQMAIYMDNCSYLMRSTLGTDGIQPIGIRPAVDAGQAYALTSRYGDSKYFFWNVGDVVDGVAMTEDDGLTYYATASALREAETDLNDFLKGILANVQDVEVPPTGGEDGGDENPPVVETDKNGNILLTQANFATLFNVATEITGNYVLTEDIDLGGTYYGTAAANIFSGTLDGQGHTIKGIEMNKDAHSGGLFYCLNGTVKNVRIEGAMTATNTKYGYGLIANRVAAGDSALVENVYIEYTGPHHSSKATHSSPTFRYNYGTLTMRNVVAYCTDANQAGGGGLVGALMRGGSETTFENCYSITTNAAINGISTAQAATDTEAAPIQNGSVTEYKGATAKADFDAAVTAGTVTLTNELKALIYPTNN